MQSLLIIAKVWPEPNSSAAGARLLQIIKMFLDSGWQVSVASTAKKNEFSFDLVALKIKCYSLELNDSSFDVFIRELKPTSVMFDRFSTEEQFGWRVSENCPDTLRILDTEDLHCLRAGRQIALKDKREFSNKDLNNTIAKREIASIYRSDLSLIISEFEMKMLKEVFKVGDNLIYHLPFLLDPLTEKEQSKWPAFQSRKGFITIGNFLHEPNADAIHYLKKEIWPLIRKQLPDAELAVYGSYPSAAILKMNDPKNGFLVKGRADDVNKVMQEARVCLAPLRFGAGLKGKLIDAMLNGTPNVSTFIGAEGMQGDLPWSGVIEDDPLQFANAAVKLYLNEGQWVQKQFAGTEIIRLNFKKQEHEKRLIEKFEFLLAHLKEQRDGNFTGAMLNHHVLQSTKYMSLWIELKNKLKT